MRELSLTRNNQFDSRGAELENNEKVNVLLIEDDPVLAVALTHLLKSLKYAVTHEINGLKADQLLVVSQYDLVILDLCLPDMDGLDILKRLRSRGSNIPVLALSARNTLTDRVQGLNFGADDYAIKPVNFNELSARIRALLRRATIEKCTLLEYEGLSLDIAGNVVTFNDKQLMLHATEFALMKLLLSPSESAVTYEQIGKSISQRGVELSNETIRVFICRLRKKLVGSGISILALTGQGYILKKMPASIPNDKNN
jgi:two-component system OmpR family response regulator